MLGHSDDGTTSEENQISSFPQETQANTPTSSLEDSSENPNTKYKTLHELYNSCSFAPSAGDPSSFDEASHHEEWKPAMEEEVATILKNNSWTLTTLLEGKKAVSLKWISKSKFLSNGTLLKRKAHLVAIRYS